MKNRVQKGKNKEKRGTEMIIGIMGNGGIVLTALNTLKQMEDMECTALLHRPGSADRARKLQEDFQIEKLYDDIDEFLNDPSFDTVYIGVINSMHYEYAKKALEAGKNVICEKPFTETAAQARELIELAERKHLMLFEANMLRYVENYERIRALLDKIGPVKMIQASYSQYSSRYDAYKEGKVLPAFDPGLGGGSLMDINIYCLHFVMGLFGQPKRSVYFPNIGWNGIDVSGTAVLDYGDFKALCTGAKDSDSDPFVIIQGENGWITVNSMLHQVDHVLLHKKGQDPVPVGAGSQTPMENEFSVMGRVIAEGDFDQMRKWMQSSLEVVEETEKMRHSFFKQE